LAKEQAPVTPTREANGIGPADTINAKQVHRFVIVRTIGGERALTFDTGRREGRQVTATTRTAAIGVQNAAYACRVFGTLRQEDVRLCPYKEGERDREKVQAIIYSTRRYYTIRPFSTKTDNRLTIYKTSSFLNLQLKSGASMCTYDLLRTYENTNS
jgi:hypothetical protein